MGVYSLDRHNMSDTNLTDPIIANESYDHVSGPARILLEAEQNDMAIFSAIICNDMMNVTKLHEGALLETELDELNEAAGAGFFETIAKALESLAAKIKGMIESFITKVSAWLSHDAKKFAEKYAGVLENKDLSGFKYTSKINTNPSSFKIDTDALMTEFTTSVFNKFANKSVDEIKSTLTGFEENDSLLCTLLETTYPNIRLDGEKNKYKKLVKENFFPETTNTGLSKDEIRAGLAVLSASSSVLKTIETQKNKDIANLAGMAKEFRNKSKDKNANKDVQTLANAQYKVTKIGQSAMVTAYSLWMEMIKQLVSETFAVLKKAVIYTPSKEAPKKDDTAPKSESTELEDYAHDVAMDEVEMAIDF